MNLFAELIDGEFGHELFGFQSFVRHLSKKHKKTTVRVRSSMRFLYEDFADEILSAEHEINKEEYSNYKFINQKNFNLRFQVDYLNKEQIFIKYGRPVSQKYDIIFHARRKRGKLCKNLSDETYNDVYEFLKNKYSIAFVGTQNEAYCPSGALDLRGIELKDLANIFSSSKLIVGESSGPIHFASLCGLTHLTWGGYRIRTLARYSYLWNPFKTKCYLFENLDNIDYIKRRLSYSGVPKETVYSDYFSIVNTEEYRVPKSELICNTIEKILNE